MSAADITTDIAIIGAGVAGTYCAYRLSRETDAEVSVFDVNDRIGGRLWTHRWDEAGTTVELGGEAFSASHAIVCGLACGELGLGIEPHKAFNTLDRVFLRNRLLRPVEMLDRRSYPGPGRDCDAVRMRYFLEEDFFVPPEGPKPFGADTVADPFEAVATHLLGHLSPEVGEAFGALLGAYGARIAEVAGLDDTGAQARPLTAQEVGTFMTRDLYARMGQVIDAVEHSTCTCSPLTREMLGVDRVPTHNLDFWSVVVNQLGQEAYALFRAAGYDNTSALSFNMVELVENLLVGAPMVMAAPHFWSIEGGFQRLPEALMAGAEARGATLRRQHRLTAVHRAEDGMIELTFARDGAATPVVCRARRVVMSAPVQSFDHGVALSGFDPELSEAFRQRRGGIASIAAGKLYLVYPRPWWSEMTDLAEGDDPLFGYASTDMPSRAVYYKGTVGDGSRALMTGALTDSSSSDFWTGFLAPEADIFPGSTEAERRTLGAPVHMVSAAQGLLQRMHAGAFEGDIPAPELALYHEWRSHGGGWSAWKSGRDIHRDAARLRQPFRAGSVDGGLYCCGDSVAERHGWVENTLESAEAMLREAFDLKAPRWIPSGDIF